jgi:hypothetical protein
MAPAELRHLGSRYRTVERDYACETSDGIEQGGRVGEADQRLGLSTQGGVIDLVQQTDRAVATADAPDCRNGGIPECLVEISQALRIRTSKIAMTLVGIFA